MVKFILSLWPFPRSIVHYASFKGCHVFHHCLIPLCQAQVQITYMFILHLMLVYKESSCPLSNESTPINTNIFIVYVLFVGLGLPFSSLVVYLSYRNGFSSLILDKMIPSGVQIQHIHSQKLGLLYYLGAHLHYRWVISHLAGIFIIDF